MTTDQADVTRIATLDATPDATRSAPHSATRSAPLDAARMPPAVMIVHEWPTGPYPARVRIALAEKGLQSAVRFVQVDLWKGEHKTPAFLAKNYSGTLPVLELDDGT